MSRPDSEDGWRPPWVDASSLNWVVVPGTNVTLQIMKGQPTAIMRAYAADYNAFVEKLRDADSASYTPTNSVSTSNHLNGTAMDLNWDSHPFHVSFAGYSPQMIATMEELEDFYEGTMFWAQRWYPASYVDSMHHQMGYGSWNNPHTADFIARKIRADGFSTFRRGNTPVEQPLSRADRYALLIIAEGQRRSITPRGIQIALSVALVESNLTMYANSNVPESMSIPHDKVGTDHDSVGLFQQRCPMWGPAAVLMDPTQSAGLFYDRLVKLDYNNTSRPPGDYAADVQRPAAQYRGRYQERMGEAVTLYDRLITQDIDPLQELLMSNTEAESLSIYATPGEGAIPLVRLLQSIDAAAHRALIVEPLAREGDFDSIDRVTRTASGQGKFRDPATVAHARKLLAEIEAAHPEYLKSYLAQKAATA